MSAYPHVNIAFSSPSGLIVSQLGNSATLTWNRQDDEFDGYEILRSYNEINNPVPVGYVSK